MAEQEFVIVPPSDTDVSAMALRTDVQFLDPYGSESINRKFFGIIPPGIYRGFKYALPGAMMLRIGLPNEPGTAVVQCNSVCITVQQTKPINLKIGAGFSGLVVLTGFYQFGVPTKQVSTTSTQDAAKLEVIAASDLKPNQVILYTVNIPAGTTALTDAMITTARRQDVSIAVESDIYQLLQEHITSPTAHTKDQVGLSNVQNWGATAAVNDPSNTKYATAGAVKTAYDLAAAALPRAGGTVGRVKIYAQSSHLTLAGENGENPWHFEVNSANGEFKVVETGVAPRFSISKGGAATFASQITATQAYTSAAQSAAANALTRRDFVLKWSEDNSRLDTLKQAGVYSGGAVKTDFDQLDIGAHGLYSSGPDGDKSVNRPPAEAWGGSWVGLESQRVFNSDMLQTTLPFGDAKTVSFRTRRTNAFGEWISFYSTAFKPTQGDVGLPLVNNWGATAAVDDASDTKYPTAGAVKKAYDLANSKLAANANAVSATKLVTARQINGTNFDGTANITTANWGTARTLTIGESAKSVNGAGNVAWSLAEIGAVPSTRRVNNKPLSADINLNAADVGALSASEANDKINDAGFKTVTLAAPAGVVAGKYYPIVVTSALEGRQEIYVSTKSTGGSDPMNNCSFHGVVRSGGWSDKGSYVDGHFTIYTDGSERAIHSIATPTEGEGAYAVYVEARAFPVQLRLPINCGVSCTGLDMPIGTSTFKAGVASPEGTKIAVVADFSKGSGHYINSNKVYHQGFVPTSTEVGLGNVQNWGATAAVNDDSDQKYPTAGAVKKAYDLANSKLAANANAVSASKWAAARTITLTGGATGSVSIDGSANVSMAVTVPPTAHTHIPSQVGLGNVNNWGATAAVNDASDQKYATAGAVKKAYDLAAGALPSSRADVFTSSGMITDLNGASGTRPGHFHFGPNAVGSPLPAGYGHGLTISNGSAPGQGVWYQQLVFGHDRKIYTRRAVNSAPTATWDRIFTTEDSPTKEDVGLPLVNNWGATAAVNDASDQKYATAGAVKKAYDLADTKLAANANAVSATKLATARQINGTAFDGTANITTANWGAARTLTIGESGKSVNGAGNVAWSLAEIGAARAKGEVATGAAGNITTAQFVQWLRDNGAFNERVWTARGSWSYGNNKTITDTGCGNIHLAGCTIEVISSHETAYTVRIVVPTTTSNNGSIGVEFVYVNNGDAYAPGWRRVYTTAWAPTAAEVGLGNLVNKGWNYEAYGDTYAVRDGAGDIQVRLLRANYPNQGDMSGAIAFRVNNSNDSYTRYCSNPAAVRAWLGVPSQQRLAATQVGGAVGIWDGAATDLWLDVRGFNGMVVAPQNGYNQYIYFQWPHADCVFQIQIGNDHAIFQLYNNGRAIKRLRGWAEGGPWQSWWVMQ